MRFYPHPAFQPIPIQFFGVINIFLAVRQHILHVAVFQFQVKRRVSFGHRNHTESAVRKTDRHGRIRLIRIMAVDVDCDLPFRENPVIRKDDRLVCQRVPVCFQRGIAHIELVNQ